MDKEKLKQCLMDTGCHVDVSENILKQYESGSMENMFRLLKKERCRICASSIMQERLIMQFL
jgi:hypothetical protein